MIKDTSVIKKEEYSWSKFVEGDKESFESIYNLNVDDLFSYGMKLYPDRDYIKDTIQDVFLDIYEHRKNLSTPKDIKFYLFTVLKHTLFRKLKAERKSRNIENINEFSLLSESSIEQITITDEREQHKRKIISKLIAELTPKQQEILYLRFNKGFSYMEISDITKINHNSVRKQVYRAIKKLRKSDIYKKNKNIITHFLFFYIKD
ncbi:sigma-70 family RNA polymerase sigma factor [Mariniflexile litorale]|uniref:Sigma-70 family RNA polymerase sigma factor n=1 Tax=Mariniflexile litorale TaxID=3045158 RepID=A0AAU7EFZ7_9FLAO|nr:sigma-70 family RNA polymerase sigma factor [Mariniflexile sp. KMM 9835]MDQ8211622.1 sigma-70 family RNA polymerase sigma factor [Mariniflexile sp. KMM 9835]